MAPRHQLLITGGKKGWISILDLPHKHQRQSFQAHESPVKALAVDPTEDCFISGSSEGNIRVFPTDPLATTIPTDISCLRSKDENTTDVQERLPCTSARNSNYFYSPRMLTKKKTPHPRKRMNLLLRSCYTDHK